MKTGDPKKAGVLGVVALVIVGVAVFQVLPKPEAKPAREAPKQSAEEVALNGGDAMPIGPIMERLKEDPFAHEKLKGKSEDDEDKDKKVQEKVDPRPKHEITGKIQDYGAGYDPMKIPSLPGTDPALPNDPTGAEITGQIGQKGQPLVEKKRLTILVEAVISIDKSRAFIKLGDFEALPFNVGERLGALGTITRITDAGVTIQSKKGRRTFPVGIEVPL